MGSALVKLCCYCSQEIPDTAKVCRFCTRHQNWWIQNLSHTLTSFGFLLSIGLFVLAIWQYQAAQTENIRAREAVQKVKDIAIIMARSAYFQITPGGVFDSGGDPKEVLQTIRQLLHEAIADPSERERVLDSFKNRAQTIEKERSE